MKITLKEWLEAESLAMRARKILAALETRLTHMRHNYVKAEHEEEYKLINRLIERVDEAQFALSASLYWVQSEWTGGDSTNPRNSTLREPNWVTISHSFPKEQVDAFRDEYGQIQIPHRKQEKK